MKIHNEIAQSAEMCAIGSVLIGEKALVNVVDTLKPEHFYFDELKDIYKAILELSGAGKTIDFISVLKSSKLKKIMANHKQRNCVLIVLSLFLLSARMGSPCEQSKCGSGKRKTVKIEDLRCDLLN